MGYSITAERATKLSKLRAEGRLCGGPATSRSGCATRATRKVISDVWVLAIGEGEPVRRTLPMCLRHARLSPVGMEGKNFKVLSHEGF